MKPKLYLINGPLGAGKTTALKYLLAQAEFKSARVIENEFANYSIDTEQFHEHEAKVETIAGVCICCSTGDELVDALTTLSTDTAPVIIEATGVANSLLLIEKLVLADMFAVYDLAHGLFVLDGAEVCENPEAFVGTHRNELLAADTVLLSKADLISARALEDIQQALRVARVKYVSIASEGNFDLGVFNRPSQMLDFYANFDEEIQTGSGDMSYTVIDVDGVDIPPDKLATTWTSLREQYGLRRLKGDFVDPDGVSHHVEATPKQFRLSAGEALSRNLVFIGSRAHQLTLKQLRDALHER